MKLSPAQAALDFETGDVLAVTVGIRRVTMPVDNGTKLLITGDYKAELLTAR